MSNRRMSKGGFALLCLYFKIDRSTLRLTTGRIHSFDIRHSAVLRFSFQYIPSKFIIRNSLFQSFFFDQTGHPPKSGKLFRPAAGLTSTQPSYQPDSCPGFSKISSSYSCVRAPPQHWHPPGNPRNQGKNCSYPDPTAGASRKSGSG